MRAAVCVSGKARALEALTPLHDYVIKPLKADVFCAFWDDAEGRKAIKTLKPKDYVLVPPIDLIPGFMAQYPYKEREACLREGFPHQDKLGSKRDQFPKRENVLNMWYLVQHCNNLKKKSEEEGGFKYECVVRARPDMTIFKIVPIRADMFEPNVIKVPHVENHHGVNDTFAYGDSETMDKYSNLWDDIVQLAIKGDNRKRESTDPQWWAWLAPELLLHRHLTDQGVTRANTRIYYTLLKGRSKRAEILGINWKGDPHHRERYKQEVKGDWNRCNLDTQKVRDTKWAKLDKPWLKYVGVKGLHTTGELAFLYETVKRLGEGKHANLGVYRGMSTFCMAAALKENNIRGTVHGIDVFNGINGCFTVREFIEYIRKLDLKSQIVIREGFTFDMAEESRRKGEKFNFVFIDANHYYQSVKDDFNRWNDLLVPHGEIAFHDCNMNSVNRVIGEMGPEWELVDHIFRIKSFKRKQDGSS